MDLRERKGVGNGRSGQRGRCDQDVLYERKIYFNLKCK